MPDTTMAEALGRPAQPALSATSDMPAIEATPEPSQEAAPETPAESTEAKPEGEVEAKPEGEAEPKETKTEDTPAKPAKPKSGISERFSEMSQARRQAEQRADKLAESLEKALAAIDKLAVKPVESDPAKAAAEDPRPKRETFDNPDAYDSALVEWSARQATRVATAETEKRLLEKAEADKKAKADEDSKAAAQKVYDDWQAKRSKALEEFPDFAEVVEADNLQITPHMTQAILESDLGPAVAYHLGKHPDEAARISSLHPLRQAIEIGRIEERLATPKATVSTTPASVKPLGSRSSATAKTPDEESMDEYAARRAAQMRAGRQPSVLAGPSKPH